MRNFVTEIVLRTDISIFFKQHEPYLCQIKQLFFIRLLAKFKILIAMNAF